ncbi:MAG TPA: tetratricopeptide repeat protein [Candidatus Obscuribacterales bacterium]
MNELTEVAILAYRNGRYRDALELLLQVIDGDPSNWMARLYLGMSYEKSGRVTDAHRLFKRLSAECPDEHIRTKAENALPLVEAEMRRRFHKDQLPTGAQKKETAKTAGDDIAWIG